MVKFELLMFNEFSQRHYIDVVILVPYKDEILLFYHGNSIDIETFKRLIELSVRVKIVWEK